MTPSGVTASGRRLAGGNKLAAPQVLLLDQYGSADHEVSCGQCMDEKRARFEAEVLPHLDAAYRFARWLSRGPGDAEDVVQEAMLRAFRAFGSLRGSAPKPWLLAIVKNCHMTALSQQQRRAFVPLPADDEVQEEEAALISAQADPEPGCSTGCAPGAARRWSCGRSRNWSIGRLLQSRICPSVR